jgi:hypothetical protein
VIEAVRLIKKFELVNPVELFKHRILIKKPQNQIEKPCQLAKNSRKIIQQLDKEQRTSSEKSIKTEIQRWKNCSKWHEWLPNSKGSLIEDDQFDLPKPIEGEIVPDWVASCLKFLKS